MGKDAAKPKKNAKKIALITAASILGVIALAVIILAPIIAVGNKVIVKDTAVPNGVLTEWMRYISDDAKITDIAIPGSHDSGCIEMPWYGATQDLTFEEQLDRGVRYFDIRVNNSKKGYVIFHGPVNGVPYQGVIDDIVAFMDAHPSEFLILDMSHFKNGSEEKVFAMLEETVGTERFLVNSTDKSDIEYIESLTMGEVRGKCLVLVDRDETDYTGKEYMFFRTNDRSSNPDAVMTSLYEKSKNGKSAKKFVGEVLPGYIDFFRTNVGEGLFVLQAQLTDNTLIFGPRYREGRVIEMLNSFIYDIYDDENSLNTVNIVMRDFVTCEKSALTLRLNLKKNVLSQDTKDAYADGLADYITV